MNIVHDMFQSQILYFSRRYSMIIRALILISFSIMFSIVPFTADAVQVNRKLVSKQKGYVIEKVNLHQETVKGETLPKFNTDIIDDLQKDDLEYIGVFQADPTIFYYEGIYYLYGTKGGNADLGFEVYRSNDLIDWEGPVGVNDGFALIASDVFGDIGFWAPQIWYEQGKFLMAYTANENIAIAMSDSPLGPFKQTKHEPIVDEGRQIDPFIFIDADGKKYLYHVKLEQGNRIFVAELNDDYSGVKKETLKECIHAALPWENVDNVAWPVAEGPTVILQDGRYYMFYSANDFRNPKYAVGVAISDNVYGPWKKIGDTALLSIHNTQWSGTGHGDVFKKDDVWYYVCHTHFSEKRVGPRRTAIVPFAFERKGDEVPKPIFNGEKMYHLKTQKEK